MRQIVTAIIFSFLISIGFPLLAQPAPQGIVINPADSTLKIEVWSEKATYVAGERLTLNIRLNETAYVYVYAINTEGNVTVLFPNAYVPDNHLEAGLHTLPSNRYSLLVEGSPGVETIQAIATFQPLALFSLAGQEPSPQSPFAALSGNPEHIAAQLQTLIAQTIEQDQWASAWTQFQINALGPHRWVIRSFPEDAALYLDGELIGLTPEEITLLPPSRAGQSKTVELTLIKDDYLIWSAKLKLTVNTSGKLRIQTLPHNDDVTINTRQQGETTFLDVQLQFAQASLNQVNIPSTTDGSNSTTDNTEVDDFNVNFRRTDGIGASLSANLGGHPDGLSTFGVEFGLGLLRLGIGLADTVDDVPEFFDVGEPIDLGTEIVYNEDPEVEFYAKLSLNVGFLEGLFLEFGGGMVIQVQAHVAAPSLFNNSVPLDVGVLPNGYRTETMQGTGIVGLAYRANGLLLQVGYDTHRGLVGGLGVVF